VEVAEARCREPGPIRRGGYVGRGADTRNMRETHQTCKTHSEDIYISVLSALSLLHSTSNTDYVSEKTNPASVITVL